MASVVKRPNGMWRMRYRDPAGREHPRHFPRKLDAQRWLKAATASFDTGSCVEPKAARTTVSESTDGE